MKKIILIIGFLLSAFSVSKTYAFNGKRVRSDYSTVTYSTRCVQSESQSLIFQQGFLGLNAVLKKYTNNLFPAGKQEDTIIEEMLTASKNRKILDSFLKQVDTWVDAEQDAHNDSLSFLDADYIPRGYMVFAGGEKSFGLGKMIGGSANLVLIMIPNCKTVWNKREGAVIEESIVDMKFKFVLNLSGGLGKKLGINFGQVRFGAGVILDPSRSLEEPGDFIGAGFSASKSNVFSKIAGSYFKAGTTWNGAHLFPFVMAGKALGVGTAISRNYGFTGFVPMESLLNVVMNLSEAKLQTLNRETSEILNVNIERLTSPEGGTIEEFNPKDSTIPEVTLTEE